VTALASNIPAYSQLLQKTVPRIIRSEEENQHFTELLEEITRKGDRASAAEEQLGELLTLLIEEFEEKHYALTKSRPEQVLRTLMDANGLRQKDLAKIFGAESTVSAMLHGKRKMTIQHVKRLCKRFGVSPELFL
jgi:HTH-type transcriptional regulator / antitoxin HigA